MRAIRGPGGFATRKLMKSSILWTKKYTSETANIGIVKKKRTKSTKEF
jgi:hypothetical protein